MRIDVRGLAPTVDPAAWVAPTAVLIGAVEVAERASVWYGVVVRADGDRITIGPGSNIQDNSVLHTDPGLHLRVGAGVVVGHRAVLHGCQVDDDVIVGMGAIVMNGAAIGSGSIVGAGALIPEGAQIPAGSLVLGAPGRVRRQTTESERAAIRANAAHYVALALEHAAAQRG